MHTYIDIPEHRLELGPGELGLELGLGSNSVCVD
jgi:hypothetical protein